MADVSDVNMQLEVPSRQTVHPYGVVEIARGFAVNGHDGQVAKVAAECDLRLRDGGGDALRVLDHVEREAVGNMMLADHDLDVNAKVILIAKYFDHPSDRVAAAIREVDDLDVDDHAFEVGRTFHRHRGWADAIRRSAFLGDRHAFRNLDPVLNSRVERLDEHASSAQAEPADNGRVRTFQDLCDIAFGAAVAAKARDANGHPVAVHRFGGGVGWKKNIIREAFVAPVRNQKSEAIAMNAQASGNELSGPGHGYSATTNEKAAVKEGSKASSDILLILMELKTVRLEIPEG